MARISGAEDWIYIHYSGHGSQADDLNGDEEDKLDETLVLYDGRTGEVPDILDDELGEILGRFRSPNLVVVLDACHSGTGTRGTTVAMRSIPKDTRRDLYRPMQPTTRAVVPLTAQRHVLLSGAAANQPALDGPIDNQYRGIFSYALMKTLASAETGARARDLIRGIETELNRLKGQLGLIDMPEPQLEAEGNRLDTPLFGSRQSAAGPVSQAKRPWIEVEAGQCGDPPQRAPFAQLRRDLVQMAVTRGIRLSADEPAPAAAPAAASAALPGDWNAAAIAIVVEASTKNR